MIKELFTRIVYDHKTEAEWLSCDYFPLAGEIIIYDPDESCASPRFKVGNGLHYPKDLPFVESNSLKELSDKIKQVEDKFDEQFTQYIDDLDVLIGGDE